MKLFDGDPSFDELSRRKEELERVAAEEEADRLMTEEIERTAKELTLELLKSAKSDATSRKRGWQKRLETTIRAAVTINSMFEPAPSIFLSDDE